MITVLVWVALGLTLGTLVMGIVLDVVTMRKVNRYTAALVTTVRHLSSLSDKSLPVELRCLLQDNPAAGNHRSR